MMPKKRMQKRVRTMVGIVAILRVITSMTTMLEIDSDALHSITIGVIGDMPYTKNQQEDFLEFINALSADPKFNLVIHLGDIKGGDSPCSNEYMRWVRDTFNAYAGALVYTPGDNEWTDCHEGQDPRNPVERLNVLRELFFYNPGITLGQRPRQVLTQCMVKNLAPCLVENQVWLESGIVFGVVHVLGSNNGLDPWTQGVGTIAEQQKEFALRLAADLLWLEKIFALTKERQSDIVILGMHADMWNPNHSTDGYSTIIQKLADLTREFGKPVLLLQGDTHKFKVDQPLINGDDLHGVTASVPNLTRIVVQGGSRNFLLEYLRITITPRHPNDVSPFFVERVTPGSGLPDAQMRVSP